MLNKMSALGIDGVGDYLAYLEEKAGQSIKQSDSCMS